MIMNARDIPECKLSLADLPIDKAWLRGYTEEQLQPVIRRFVETTDYDRYIIVSDDVIVTRQALDNLLRLQDAGPVVTGWCNIFPDDTLASVKLLPLEGDLRPPSAMRWMRDHLPKAAIPLARRLLKDNRGLYAHFPREEDIWAKPPLFRTYLLNWALTSMSRKTWLDHPFKPAERDMRGAGSDLMMSLALAEEGVDMLCARDSFVFHLKTTRNFIVGKQPPEVRLEVSTMRKASL